jgi:hypothetical protein
VKRIKIWATEECRMGKQRKKVRMKQMEIRIGKRTKSPAKRIKIIVSKQMSKPKNVRIDERKKVRVKRMEIWIGKQTKSFSETN